MPNNPLRKLLNRQQNAPADIHWTHVIPDDYRGWIAIHYTCNRGRAIKQILELTISAASSGVLSQFTLRERIC